MCIHFIGPAAVFCLVQPEGMQAPVVGRKKDFLFSVTIEVGHYCVGLIAFDPVVVFAQGRAGIHQPLLPVCGCCLEARTVRVEDQGRVVFALVAIGTVIHVADGDHFIYAVCIHVGSDGRAFRKVGAKAFAANAIAASPAPEFGSQVFPDAYCAPVLAGIGSACGDLHTVFFVGANVMNIGRHDNLAESVTIEIAHGGIVVEDAPGGGFAVATELRPPGPKRAVVLVYSAVGLAVHRSGDDDLHEAVGIQVGYTQTPQFPVRGFLGPAGFEVSLAVVHGHPATAVGSDDLLLPVSIHICQHNAGPGTTDIIDCITLVAVVTGFHAPFQAAVTAIQHMNGIAGADDFRFPILVQIGDGRRGIPAGLAPGGASSQLPLENGRGDTSGRAIAVVAMGDQ